MKKILVLYNKTLVIGTIILLVGIAIAPLINANVSAENVDIKLSGHNFSNMEPNAEPLSWIDRWPDLPGRYEPMFDVYDVIEFEQTTWGLSSADFNDDGELDFAVSWSTAPWTQSTISIFYNHGENDFTQNDVYTITSPPRRYFKDLDSADYDNDGDTDLMFTYSISTSSIDDGFVNVLFNDGENNFGNLTIVAELIEGDRINPQLTSDDFDNDGDIDFLVGDNSGLVEFFKNDGTGNFISACLYDFGMQLSRGLSSADFDNDGDIDFIVTQHTKGTSIGNIYLVWNDGSESCFNQSNFVNIVDLPPPTTSFFTCTWIRGYGCLQSIDYNDDGMMDFIFSGSDSVFLYMQKDIGVFDYFHIMRLPAITNDEGTGWTVDDLRMGGICTGDFNNDNLNDLIIGGDFGFVRICYNNFVLVDIVKPDTANLYISNEMKWFPFMAPIRIYSFIQYGKSIVIGDLTVEVKALAPLQKVEFYLGNKLKFTDETEPFEWEWSSFSFGRKKVKAVGFDMDGEQVGFDDTIVWKFL
jgi:hypothetical protein